MTVAFKSKNKYGELFGVNRNLYIVRFQKRKYFDRANWDYFEMYCTKKQLDGIKKAIDVVIHFEEGRKKKRS